MGKKLHNKLIFKIIVLVSVSLIIISIKSYSNKGGSNISSNVINEEIQVKEDKVTIDRPTSKEEDSQINIPDLNLNPADDTYFEDAVFLGNSLTESFLVSTGLKAKGLSKVGLNVNTVFSKPIVKVEGKKLTAMEALEDVNFSKVYIMLGVNETGWVYSNIFIDKYITIINKIKEINPDAKIYIQSILPVSEKMSQEHDYIKNEKINEYNSLLKKMAEENKVYYLAVNEIFKDDRGALPEEYTTDGMHIKPEYCNEWLEYLKKHIEN